MWLLLLCALLSALWLVRRWRVRRLSALDARVGSGLPSLPLLGQTLFFFTTDNKKTMNNVVALAKDAISRGGLSSHWLMDKLMLNVTDAEIAAVLLRTCNNKGDSLRWIRTFFGNATIFATADVWRPRKKQFLSPMFASKNINALFDTFTMNLEVMLDQLEKRWLPAGRGVLPGYDLFKTNSFDNAYEAAFGEKLNAQLQERNPIAEAFEEITRIGGFMVFNFWFFNWHLHKVLQIRPKTYVKPIVEYLRYVKESVKKKQEEWRQAEHSEKPITVNADGPVSMIELMRRAGVRRHKLLREETLGMLIAGTDTVTVTSSFTMLMLAAHPRVQDKVYQELAEIFGDSQRPVTLADLPRMKYLEAAIKETTRLYPPGTIIMRDADADVLLPNGLTVPKGCCISINIYGIHRNPKYWGDDAAEYRPERFFKPLSHPQAYLAFSYGSRGCPGAMYAMHLLKINLSSVLRRYRLLPAPGVPREPQLLYQVTLKAENFDVILEPRTQPVASVQ